MLKPSVQVHAQDGVFVAEFWDCLRLDPAPVQDLRREFEDHLRRKGRPDLVVDLLGVGFAGSAALGGFVALQRTARQHKGRMVFCNVDPTVREVFKVSKLESLYTFASDRASAIALILTEPAAPDAPSSGDMPAVPAEPSAPARPRSTAIGGDRLRRRKPEA
ncbi:MAG: STAS domain-containing protein [Isosphaeraceae bacterium]|nr:STAS domain-containing protein [Isosphaeraceae bacterium]